MANMSTNPRWTGEVPPELALNHASHRRPTRAACILSPQTDRTTSNLAIEPGTVLGRFTVTALLGAGATGSVYRAHDGLRDADVAIKVALVDGTAGHNGASQLRWEATVSAAIADHRHVIQVHDIHAATVNGHDVTVMSMEHADGGAIDKWIEDHVASADHLPSAVKLLCEAAQGLKVLHESGFWHGDALGRNFVIVSHRAKLADLGEAQGINSTWPRATSACEDGPRNRDGVLTDIRMFGTILAQAALYSLGNSAGILDGELQGRSPDEYVDSRAWEGTPIAHIIARCVDQDSGRPYRQVQELIDDLVAYLESTGTTDLPERRPGSRRASLMTEHGLHRLVVQGDWSTALHLGRRLVEMYPHRVDSATYALLVTLQDRSQQADALSQAAAQALDKADLSEASRLVDAAGELFPGHPGTSIIQTRLKARMQTFHELVRCGRGQIERGHLTEAICYYSRAFEFNRNACWLVGTIGKLKAGSDVPATQGASAERDLRRDADGNGGIPIEGALRNTQRGACA